MILAFKHKQKGVLALQRDVTCHDRPAGVLGLVLVPWTRNRLCPTSGPTNPPPSPSGIAGKYDSQETFKHRENREKLP